MRDLWAFTGDYKLTNNYNDWISDYVAAALFANVATGEIKEFPIVSFVSSYGSIVGGSMDDYLSSLPTLIADRGTYYDISASTTKAGVYVATEITEAKNVYTGKYIIDDYSFLKSGSRYYCTMDNKNVYFDGSDVVVYVGTGFGSKFEVKTYNGIEAFKTAYGVASNGKIGLKNAALTVTATKTGDYYVNSIFVFVDNVDTESNYIFIPNNIAKSDWSEVTGDPGSYYVTYKGAYLEGKPVDFTFTKAVADSTEPGPRLLHCLCQVRCLRQCLL